MADNFRSQILNAKTESAALQSPIRKMGSCTFIYLRHNDVYVVGITRNNANVMLALKFMTSVGSGAPPRPLPSPRPAACSWDRGLPGPASSPACAAPLPGSPGAGQDLDPSAP
jgi:hypothetical protein